MRFCDIPGNEDVKRALVNMADTGRVAHAVLFFENEGCGAFPLAVAYLQYLACPHRHDGDSCGECPSCNKISKLIHPDVHFVFPTNTGSKSGSLASKDVVSDVYANYFREMAVKNPYFMESDLSEAIGIEGKVGDISVSEAKSIIDKLSLAPVENGYKAIVMLLPEKLTIGGANKLLKVLEEPPEKSIFLLVTHHPDNMLQTIFSRCQGMRVLPLEPDQVADVLVNEYDMDSDEAEIAAGLSGGSVGKVLQQMSESEDREAYKAIFTDLMNAVLSRDLLAALDTVDAMVALDSREKQKAFCAYLSEELRKIFMLSRGLEGIAYASEDEKEFILGFKDRLPENFCLRAFEYTDKAESLLERNVNQKILFCDLVNRFFISI